LLPRTYWIGQAVTTNEQAIQLPPGVFSQTVSQIHSQGK
jgi:hypothetical protein